MKKLIVCLIMVCVIISMTACGSEKNEATTNTNETVATGTSDEVNVTESTEIENIGETGTTVIETEPQESTSNKNEGNNQNTNNSGSGNGTTKPNNSNTNNDKTENQKPSSKPSSGGNTTSKPTSKPNNSTTKPNGSTTKPTVKPTTPTTKPTSKPTPKPTTPATKPTTKPTTPTTKPTTPEKPYFVSLEYVSETRPNTFYVDGMDVLTRVYGKAHYAYQTGDTVTYKVNMSDGGNKGFEIYDTFGCDAKISGNKIIVTINGRANSASVEVRVQTKNGYENKCICDLRVYKPTENLDYHRDFLARIYGENIGMEWVNGYTNHESGIFERVAPNEMFNTMDKLKHMGCTKFDCQTDSTEFQISAGN